MSEEISLDSSVFVYLFQSNNLSCLHLQILVDDVDGQILRLCKNRVDTMSLKTLGNQFLFKVELLSGDVFEVIQCGVWFPCNHLVQFTVLEENNQNNVLYG